MWLCFSWGTNVHKSTKVIKAKAHIAHRNVFLINFFTFSTHRPSSSCWNVQWTCAASFYGWRYSCCYCDTHAQWGDTRKTCTIHPIFSSATYVGESFRQMRDLKSTAPNNMWQMKYHFINALIVNTKPWIDIISTRQEATYGEQFSKFCLPQMLCAKAKWIPFEETHAAAHWIHLCYL